MIYLFLQAVFSSCFGLLIKWVGNRNRAAVPMVNKAEDIFVVGAINYIVAAIAIAPEFFQNDVGSLSSGALISGGAMGAIYFIAYFFVIYAIKWVGVSATSVVGVLSILMPITLAAFIWEQKPNELQIAGICMALLALTLIGGKKGGMQAKSGGANDEERPWFASIVLFTFFLLCGGSRISQEAFKHVSVESQRPTFLFTAFVVASIPSVILLLHYLFVRKHHFKLGEIVFGIGLGISNIVQSHFILKSLEIMPGFIVFPVTSAGAILITTLVAVSLLGERLNFRTYVGIGIATVALFLLNWN